MSRSSSRSADLVLGDEAVEGLAVDAGSLRRRRDVAAVALQQVAKIRALERPHPALPRFLQRQPGDRAELRGLPRGRCCPTGPERLGVEQVVGEILSPYGGTFGQRAGALDDVLQLA